MAKEETHMKCKCGGELKRIQIGTYQCLTCGKFQAVALAELPVPDKICIEILNKAHQDMLITLAIPEKYFNK